MLKILKSRVLVDSLTLGVGRNESTNLGYTLYLI